MTLLEEPPLVTAENILNFFRKSVVLLPFIPVGMVPQSGGRMRYPRVAPMGVDTFMHVYNRVAGSAGEYPFGPVEKEAFVRRLSALTEFYVIEVMAYQVMGNHFHVLVHVPAELPSPEEAVKRYQVHYRGKRRMDPQSHACQALMRKLRDISAFMRDLEQPFSRWFNRTRPVRRRGHLWAERFKNTVLEDGLAVWDCWKYIEMNPVRAHLVADPADYRFCSTGYWSATGHHPFESAIERRLMASFRGLLGVQSLADLHRELRKEFARIRATEARQSPEQINAAIAVAAEKERFTTCVDRRVRYWVDGMVIGSERFVLNTLSITRTHARFTKRPWVQAVASDLKQVDLYCCRQLRVLVQ